MTRPPLHPDVGPVPNYQPPDTPPPPAPAPVDPFDQLVADFEALHRRCLEARADERMRPLGRGDVRHFSSLLDALRKYAAAYPYPLPTLTEPPEGMLLALADLLPHLATALRVIARLLAWQGHNRQPS